MSHFEIETSWDWCQEILVPGEVSHKKRNRSTDQKALSKSCLQQYNKLQSKVDPSILSAAYQLVLKWRRIHIKPAIPLHDTSSKMHKFIVAMVDELGGYPGLKTFLQKIQQEPLSHRLMDFVLTQYHKYALDIFAIEYTSDAMNPNCYFEPPFPPHSKRQCVHELYQEATKYWTKMYFDIYGRGNVVEWKGLYFVPCQLKFYIFLVKEGILQFIQKNRTHIIALRAEHDHA